ncbi:MerR family transcriptional regulator [Geomicrobium sp. JCM 19055]|uniref:MerR family transcriptional regulator n=1 Tax=Geomicrobium sp. JCM 19055 TaxID=1460649 RepID=UPI00223581A9|nr:MerR family transcriptional regulator [Geomicrobium sp. JCM 19055]
MKDIVNEMNLPRSTITDWLSDFHMYIPIHRNGSRKLYKRETIDVLRAIHEYRTMEIDKQEIMYRLKERFPIVLDDEDDREAVIKHLDHIHSTDQAHPDLMNFMRLQATTVRDLQKEQIKLNEVLEEQEKTIASLTNEQGDHTANLNILENRIKEMEDKHSREYQSLKTELETEKNKTWLQKLLGK